MEFNYCKIWTTWVIKEALNIFEEMQHVDINPNQVTFISVLSNCKHKHMLGDKYVYFNSLTKVYKLFTKIHYYVCVIDLVGRTRLLDTTI